MDFGLKVLASWLRSQNYPDGVETRAVMNARGDLSVAHGLPPKSELTRLGNTWSMTLPAANHFTPVAALPTTRAELVLYNGEPGGGKSYLIDAVYGVVDTSIAAAAAMVLLGQLVPSSTTALTDNTSILINSRSGKPSYGGKAKKALGSTAYGIADRWEALQGAQPAGPSASIGLAAYAECYGGFIVPPGGFFLANAIFGTAAGTALLGIVWHEVQLPLG